MTAMVHRLKGEPEQLLRAIERLIAMNPDHADALYWTAWSYMSMGRPEQGVGILERVVEDVSFDGPDLENKHVVINGEYVRGRLTEILQKEDLSKFIL